MLSALVLAAGIGARAAQLRAAALDSTAGDLKLDGYAFVELRVSDDDGVLERVPGLKGWARLQRGLGPGPDRSLLSGLTPLERAIEPFGCRPYGALFVRLRTDAGPLDVYSVQLAGDDNGRSSPCRGERVSQAFELAQIVERRSARQPFVIFARPPKKDDEAYRTLAELLNLAPLGNGRLLVPESARVLAAVEGAPAELRLDPRFLKTAPKPDPARRASALLAVRAALDEQLRDSLRRSRWTWVPVYGLAVSLRQNALRERLDQLRARAETARILAVETK